MEWVKVYDLREDHGWTEWALKEVLRPEPFSLGSPGWWDAIEGGELESHWVTGVIKHPLWTGMNDFPEVEVVDESGDIAWWERRGDVTQYSKGGAIRIRWLRQRRKEPIEGLGDTTKVVLEVWLEAGKWRPTAAFGPGPGRSLDEGWEGGPAES